VASSFDQLVDSVLITDKDGAILYANPAFERVTGYSGEEVLGKTPRILKSGEHPPEVYQELWRQLLAGNPYRFVFTNRKKNGELYEEGVQISPLRNADGEVSCFVSVGRVLDGTDRKLAEERLQDALSLYTATVEATADGMVVTDNEGQIVAYNSKFLEMWSLEPPASETLRTEAVMPQILGQLRQPEAFLTVVTDAHERNGSTMISKVELTDDRVYELYARERSSMGASGKVWSFRDVTERERMESTLLDLANLDSLTGVPNRRRFQEEVNASISRGEHGAVLFMDVDDFKAINDSLGHSAGDEFLRSLALCLSEGLRHDDMLARLGGDEFAVLLRGASRGEAMAVAQRLLKSVREMRSVSADQPLSSTISIGGAMFPTHGTSVDELLGHADMAMYRVKQGGRNGLHFYQASHGSKSSSMSRVVWKQKILHALENDGFVLYAQPIFELRTRRLGCYELLLRLREPNGTLVLPGRFLPAAERSGLVHQIDAWVVERSLAIAKELALAPRPAKVAFNLSATAVGNTALLDLIKREVSRLGVDPGYVSIEVTETALISDLPMARAFLRGLKDMGFLLALDDFGAGFSSFSRLREVPADYLKIDGSFVQNITRNREDRHFVRAIADLASGLGIGAVAESVEDAEAVDILIDLGVLNGQGYYLGAPGPLDRILDSHLAA
jgi:diguanylate cyclase (GGDEF)-like protein/PAS domain S-box-containing protein